MTAGNPDRSYLRARAREHRSGREVSNQSLQFAYLYAERGIAVFPVNPDDKTPMCDRGCLAATTDPKQIRNWWSVLGYAGIGAATGQVSGFVAIDVDPQSGGEDGIRAAEEWLGALPEGGRVTTRSGGRHHWLRIPEGVVIKNSVSAIGPGVDVRGKGGYVVAPPTAGTNGGWSWMPGQPRGLPVIPDRWLEALAEAPSLTVEEQLAAQAEYQKTKNQRGGDEAGKPETDWPAEFAYVPEGQRNQKLAKLTGHLLGKRIQPAEVMVIMMSINQTSCRPPLSSAEAERTIRSIIEIHGKKAQK